MKISDLKLGQTGYYGYLYCGPHEVSAVKFVEVKIDGDDYIVCIRTERGNTYLEVQKKFECFFDTFATFSHHKDRNYECFLTKEELLENNKRLILEEKLKELEEEKDSLLDIKKELLDTEKMILDLRK